LPEWARSHPNCPPRPSTSFAAAATGATVDAAAAAAAAAAAVETVVRLVQQAAPWKHLTGDEPTTHGDVGYDDGRNRTRSI